MVSPKKRACSIAKRNRKNKCAENNPSDRPLEERPADPEAVAGDRTHDQPQTPPEEEQKRPRRERQRKRMVSDPSAAKVEPLRPAPGDFHDEPAVRVGVKRNAVRRIHRYEHRLGALVQSPRNGGKIRCDVLRVRVVPVYRYADGEHGPPPSAAVRRPP